VFVYFAINSVNLKMYIGKSNNPERRWAAHLRQVQTGSSYVFHRAIRKHGIDAFAFDILEECSSDEEAFIRETYWVAVYDTHVDNGNGYNMTGGGDGVGLLSEEAKARKIEGIRLANLRPEVKEKHSLASKAMWEDEEFRRKRIEALNDPEVIARNRESGLRNWEDDDYRERCTAVMNTPERKDKSRQSMKELTQSPDWLEKQRILWETPEYKAAQLAGVNDPEHKRRQSEDALARWQDPAFLEIHQKGMFDRYNTPERVAIKERVIELRKSGMQLEAICREVDRGISVIMRILSQAGMTDTRRGRRKSK
jgi:group I intron endonuclease